MQRKFVGCELELGGISCSQSILVKGNGQAARCHVMSRCWVMSQKRRTTTSGRIGSCRAKSNHARDWNMSIDLFRGKQDAMVLASTDIQYSTHTHGTAVAELYHQRRDSCQSGICAFRLSIESLPERSSVFRGPC